MTCTHEKCNQKRVIDCLFVKVDVNLHIARQIQLFLKVNSLSSGTMGESCWESSSEGELFLTQSTFTFKSDEYDGKYLLSVYESRGGTSDFRLPTSDFRLPTSDFRLQTSDFRLQTSDFRLPTSDFRLPTSDMTSHC